MSKLPAALLSNEIRPGSPGNEAFAVPDDTMRVPARSAAGTVRDVRMGVPPSGCIGTGNWRARHGMAVPRPRYGAEGSGDDDSANLMESRKADAVWVQAGIGPISMATTVSPPTSKATMRRVEPSATEVNGVSL